MHRQGHYCVTFTRVHCLLTRPEAFSNITELLAASHLDHFSICPGGLILSPVWKEHDSLPVKHPIPPLSHVLGPCWEGVLPCAVHPGEEQAAFSH